MDDASRNFPLQFPNQFELYDFTDDPNFDRYINLISVESEDIVACNDYNLIDGCFVDDHKRISSTPWDTSGLGASSSILPEPNYVFNPLPNFNGEMMDGEEANHEEISLGTTTATVTATKTATKKANVDRSRALTSERMRRDRMKDKLYALRSLVPNITKMDTASIIGDAALYVQDLQMQAKKLKVEIAGLEATLAGTERYQEFIDNPVKIRVARNNSHPACKKIILLNMFQVEEREFYIRLICNKDEGVAISLQRALESLTNFKVQNSNLATVSDRFVLTFTLNIRDNEHTLNLPNLKLWISGAFLNQGFEVVTPLFSDSVSSKPVNDPCSSSAVKFHNC